jgi:hypothetical protein
VSKRNPQKPANLRSWRVIIIRSKGDISARLKPPDRERAEAAAIKQLDLDQDQRRQLLIREAVTEPPV